MDSDGICRACSASSEQLYSLFSHLDSAEVQLQLSEMLTQCTSVQIDLNDGLPDSLCQACLIELTNAYSFRMRCVKTDLELRQQFRRGQDQAKPDTSDTKQIACVKCNETFPSSCEHNCDSDSTYLFLESDPIKVEADLEIKTCTYQTKSEDKDNTDTTTKNHSVEEDNTAIKDKYYVIGDRYVCVECNASLSTMGNLYRHLKIHKSKEHVVNICHVCQKTFSRSDSLSEHMKRHEHTKEFECHICKKTYWSKNTLTSHMYTHASTEGKLPKERIHQCSYCKKSFMSNSSLVIHIRTHTKEKPFLCQTCGKGFATRGGVDLHQRRHTGERPFKCEFCGRGFAESSNLKVHIRAHTGDRPHLCSLCGKRFTRMFLLQLHMRTHTGEKPYKCPECPKAFAQQGDLAAHKRTHTGQRPHKCTFCEQGFIKSSGLKKHILSKHTNDLKTKVESVSANQSIENLNLMQNNIMIVSGNDSDVVIGT